MCDRAAAQSAGSRGCGRIARPRRRHERGIPHRPRPVQGQSAAVDRAGTRCPDDCRRRARGRRFADRTAHVARVRPWNRAARGAHQHGRLHARTRGRDVARRIHQQSDAALGHLRDAHARRRVAGPDFEKRRARRSRQARAAMKPLRFTKMQGLGNDFVVIDATRAPFTLTASQIRTLADRRFGVGCDQVLVVEAPPDARADFRYRIYNADGGEVEQCGNGARCFMVFVRKHGLSDKTTLTVETLGGTIVPELNDDGEVTVDMGVPRFRPEDVPFVGGVGATAEALDVAGARVEVSVLSMGNPHTVQVVADVSRAPVATQGPLIENHPRFPQRVNAGYMEIVDRANIRLRVWERGTGETLACGTGACAAVVAGIRRGLLDREVRVATRGGTLSVTWTSDSAPVRMKGAATTVFEGEWTPPSS